MKETQARFHFSDFLWDAWCIGSVIGIWPRFIEPNLLETNKLILNIPNLPPVLKGLKIVQFTDIHLNPGVSDRFLRKLTRRILEQKPDIIVFTGDFLCFAQTQHLERLKAFLNTLTAPHGCFAVLGNHDYQAGVSINEQGEYDILVDDQSMIKKGLSRLLSTPKLARRTSLQAKAIPPNKALCETLKETPFKLLHNETAFVPIKDAGINVCGLGEYILARTQPSQAFQSYKPEFPGIILLHNPDGIPLLADYPGEVVLCGHTHGGQVYLPWMWKRFTLMENMQFIRGLHHAYGKTIYINRGVAGIMTFRWRAKPEILLLTLERPV